MTNPASDLPPAPAPEAADAAVPQTPASARVLRPLFLGTGSEYFGIWIINILLIVLTVGLYYPWARVRRLQFFAGSTELDGYRLSFTAVAKQMLPGFSIALIAFFIYTIAETVSPLLSLLLLALFGLVWPWLMRAALRFRLARTAWRGLSFAFAGSVRGAYASFVPMIVLAAVVAVIGGLAVFAESAELVDSLSFSSGIPGLMVSTIVILLLALGLGLLFIPWIHCRIKHYQHSHFRFADRQSEFTAGPARFYGLYLKSALVALGALLPYLALTALVAGVGTLGGGNGEFTSVTVGIVSVLWAILGWQIVAAYFVSRLHNLVWSHTVGNDFAFAAALRFWPFLWLRLVNLILKIVTLGLFIPYAQVAIARMKIESIALAVSVDLDALIAQAQQGRVSAGADAAADLFDMDLGL